MIKHMKAKICRTEPYLEGGTGTLDVIENLHLAGKLRLRVV